jgi:hypothetical protein
MAEFLKFWWQCIVTGWQVGDGFFGFLEIITFLVSNFLRARRRLAKHVKPWETFAMKFTFWVFLISFGVSTICVAPFLSNKETNHQLFLATNELASLGPVVPFELYSNQLAAANETIETFSNAAADYKCRWIGVLTEINFAAPPDTLQAVINDLVKNQTNEVNGGTLEDALHNARDITALNAKKAAEEARPQMEPIYNIWKYAISTIQRTSVQESKCSNCVEEPFPTIDSICLATAGHAQIVSGNLESGCGWNSRFFLRGFPQPGLRLFWNGDKPKSATMDLNYDEFSKTFSVSLNVQNEVSIGRKCPLDNISKDMPKCIENTAFILSLLNQEMTNNTLN